MSSPSPARNYKLIGLLGSTIGHIVLAYLIISPFSDLSNFKPPVVYSVTLEGGKSLGAISQVAKKKKEKPKKAPPKKVKEKEPPKEKPKPKPKKTETKKQKKPEPKPDTKAEVSLAEKKKSKPKPTPKPKPKPTPKKKTAPKKPAKKKPKTLSRSEINKRLQQAVQRYTGESTDAGGSGFGAGRIGSGGMGGGTLRGPEFFAYKRLLETHLKSEWNYYDTSAPLQAQVSFSIDPRGNISKVKLSTSSGDSGFDNSVLRAVKKASPAPVPPAKVYKYFREVRITFDPRD